MKKSLNLKTAIVNISSFGAVYPEFVKELESKIGLVEKFTLPQDMSGKELANVLNGFTFVLLGNYPTFNQEFFSNNDDVKLIARHGIGYNNIDINSANLHHVVVTKMISSIETNAVAEQALCLMMVVSKRIITANRKVHTGEWQTNRLEMMGMQIFGKTTGIIGCGCIGKRLAQIMKFGFNNRVLVYDPYANQDDLISIGVEMCSLDMLLQQADFISLHANLTEESKHIINKEKLRLVKHNAIVINTGRGSLVDESAIFEALIDNRLFGYGADVSEIEPIENNNRLLKLENVIITPHTSIYNLTCMKEMNRKVVDDIYDFVEGKRLTECLTEFE